MGGVEGIGRRWPNLAASVEALQGSLRSVLPGGSWEPMGRLPSPGALCFESPQVACYEKGQQFMAHEDAFPAAVMVQNEFQRRATLLVYLNDVAGGGGTRFVHLGVTIRTLHEAQVAEDTKWIAQQWVAWGVGGAWGVGLPAAAAGFEELLKQRKQSSGGKKGKKGQAATKGFGKR